MNYAILGRNAEEKKLQSGTCGQKKISRQRPSDVPFPHWLIQSWFHRRILRTIAERLTLRAVLDALVHSVAIGSVILTALSLPVHYELHGWIVVLVLLGLSAMRWFFAFISTKAPNSIRREVVKGFFAILHEDVFFNSPDFRFTYFVRDPIARARVSESKDGQGRRENTDILVPIVRRPIHGTAEEVRSKTYFPVTSRSVAAQAWQAAASARSNLMSRNFDALINEFPGFRTRAEMEHYYVEKLGMDQKTLSRISGYMFDVVQIFSFPLADNDGNVVGLVSIDSKKIFRTEIGPEGNESGAMQIDGAKLIAFLEAMQTTLVRISASNR